MKIRNEKKRKRNTFMRNFGIVENIKNIMQGIFGCQLLIPCNAPLQVFKTFVI